MSDPESEEMRTLDTALAQALRPPMLPSGFERRLAQALAETPQEDWQSAGRARLEREHREKLAELQADYVRLRRRTLGTAIGAAFAAGAAVAFAMPWIQASFGGTTVLYVLLGAGTLLGVGLAAASVGAGRLGGLIRLLD